MNSNKSPRVALPIRLTSKTEEGKTMYRLAYYGCLTLCMSLFMGCAMCCGPFDDDYNHFGGRFHRSNPEQGRVGSILSDPVYMGGGPSADSNLSNEPAGGRSGGFDAGSESEFRDQIDRMRQDIELDGDGNELPVPRTPQPAAGNDRETSRGWQNHQRGRIRHWR